MELRLDRISIGFDFSLGGQAALAAALQLARRVDAELTLITAVPGALEPVVVNYLKGRPAQGDKLEIEASFLERVEGLVRSEVVKHETSGLRLRYDIGQESATKMLLHSSHATGADLLVLGAVGNKPPKAHHTVGMDVERVIRASGIPVLVVRPGKAFPPERILCAVDFSEASERATGWAFDFARMFGAEVEVVHVVPRESTPLVEMLGQTYPPGYMDAQLALTRRTLDDFLSGLPTGGVTLHTRLLEGSPSEVIIEHLETGHYDLLCIGTLGRSALMEMLVGGTAERVIRGSATSILAVKPDRFALRSSSDARTSGILGASGLVR